MNNVQILFSLLTAGWLCWVIPHDIRSGTVLVGRLGTRIRKDKNPIQFFFFVVIKILMFIIATVTGFELLIMPHL